MALQHPDRSLHLGMVLLDPDGSRTGSTAGFHVGPEAGTARHAAAGAEAKDPFEQMKNVIPFPCRNKWTKEPASTSCPPGKGYAGKGFMRDLDIREVLRIL
jgi:hypothetical protein